MPLADALVTAWVIVEHGLASGPQVDPVLRLRAGFLETARHHLRLFEREMGRPDRTRADLVEHLDALSDARREALAPVERLTANLHKWVAFAVMPLFALANAGVELGSASFTGDGFAVFAGVALGLLVGKAFGILAFSWLAVRLGLAALPTGVRWPGVAIVGLVGGIGFTMALFVAQLAFTDPGTLAAVKLGVLLASGSAALLGLCAGRALLPAEPGGARGALSADEAESSTEA